MAIEILGYFLLLMQLFFANLSGLGGGYFSVIILYELFRFEWFKTMSYASYMNFVVSIVRFIYHFKEKNPKKPHHTLIDYELVVLFLPLSILGLLIGHIIYNILPMFVIAVLMGIFWGGISIDLSFKAYRRFRRIKQMISIRQQRQWQEDKIKNKIKAKEQKGKI